MNPIRRQARDIERQVRLARYHLKRGERALADAALAKIDLAVIQPGTSKTELYRLSKLMDDVA